MQDNQINDKSKIVAENPKSDYVAVKEAKNDNYGAVINKMEGLMNVLKDQKKTA